MFSVTVHSLIFTKRQLGRRRLPLLLDESEARSLMSKAYDAVVVGAGHTGLVCVPYLARTLMLERRNAIGGAALTQQIASGFSRVHFLVSCEYFAFAHHRGLRSAASRPGEYAVFGRARPARRRRLHRFFDEIAKTRKSFARFNKRNGEIQSASECPNYCIIRNGGLRCRKRQAVRARGRVSRLYANEPSGEPKFGSTRAAWKKIEK
jgi:glycine/D-amino acid oxidase-like deaminating enzyme